MSGQCPDVGSSRGSLSAQVGWQVSPAGAPAAQQWRRPRELVLSLAEALSARVEWELEGVAYTS